LKCSKGLKFLSSLSSAKYFSTPRLSVSCGISFVLNFSESAEPILPYVLTSKFDTVYILPWLCPRRCKITSPLLTAASGKVHHWGSLSITTPTSFCFSRYGFIYWAASVAGILISLNLLSISDNKNWSLNLNLIYPNTGDEELANLFFSVILNRIGW